jgi:ClpP class serine protease
MGTEIFWLIFFIVGFLQPIMRQKMLEAARLKMLERIEKKRGTRVISLIHRQETMSLFGFPLMRYIDIEDAEAVLRAIQMTDDDVPIDIILHTPGGLVLASEQIACAIRRHKADVTVFVPHYAMSGGTLIALAADRIVMDPNAVLGPVDPQLGNRPAASILKVLQRKPISEVDDETIILADIAEKALRQVRNVVVNLVSERRSQEDAERLAEVLSSGTWTHDYPITVDQAQELGLPVSTDMPAEIYQLMNLFPQTRQRRPSVEYIPVPYGPREPDVHPAPPARPR